MRRSKPIPGDAGSTYVMTEGGRGRRPPYSVTVLAGRLYFQGVQVDQITDHVDHTYTQAGCLPREAAVRLAFAAGYEAGKRSVEQ